MALGLNTTSSGDFLPICIWDARAGRFFRVDRTQGVNGWESERVDITMEKPKFAVDFGSIETGYQAFTPTGPDFHMAPFGSPLPERPSKEHKLGFRVKIAGKTVGGVREFAASAKAVLASMDTLHSQFEAAAEAASGKIPVVELSGSTAIVTNGPQGKVTSYSPVFTIVSWTNRLPEMGDRTVAPPGASKPTISTPVNHVPPPTSAQAPAEMPMDWE